MDLLLSPLYTCNISTCSGCWITEAGIQRIPAQHTTIEWLNALNQMGQEIRKIDICGGEPLIWNDLYTFCSLSPWDWAITTNLLSERYLAFVKYPLSHNLCWTCTYHPESKMSRETFGKRVLLLKTVYQVNIAIMSWGRGAKQDTDWFKGCGFTVALEPFEKTPGPMEKPTFTCDGGQSFAFLTPNGDVYPCVDSQRAQANRLGNIFRHDVQWPTERLKCNLECNSYKNLPENHPSGDVHGLKVEKLKGA